jgi:sugar-specific transcriptional regulator TrmB
VTEVGRVTYIEDASNDIVRAMKRATALAVGEVFNPIQKWIRATVSRMLRVEGAANFSPVSDVSFAAAHIRAIVRQADIPCVAFICKIRHRDSAKIDPSRTRQSDGLVALVYSLIRQLASLAPSSIQDKKQYHS